MLVVIRGGRHSSGMAQRVRASPRERLGCRSTKITVCKNVAALNRDPYSLLSLYHRLIELRRQHHALSVGAVRVLAIESDVLIFERSCEGERIIVALNFGDEGAPINVPEVQGATALLSTFMDWTGKSTKARLRPSEGIMFRAA